MWGLRVLIPLLGAGALRVSQDPEEILRQAQGNDTGRYLCQVTLEIPHHDTAIGNGTQLSVSTAAADGGHRGWCGGLAGALGGTALLLGLAVLSHRCWRRNSDAIIYTNVMPASVRVPELLPSPRSDGKQPIPGGAAACTGPPRRPSAL
ncbi:unnamed protein product, partial [Bubo scandiacus]